MISIFDNADEQEFRVRIAFITCSEQKQLTLDDKILADLARERGIRHEVLVWDDESINWEKKRLHFDYLVIRSLWDYVLKIENFKKWLEHIQSLGIRVLNDLKAIKWNIDKNYLSEFQPLIIPTVFIRSNEGKSLLESIEEGKRLGVIHKDQNEFVFKPCIGSAGYGTTKFNLQSIASCQERYLELLTKSDLILQPFISSIHEHGEISFLFFNGKFSHSIIKRPGKHDFRVQDDYGGTAEKNVNPPPSEVELAQSIMNQIIEKHHRILYARIDMMRIEGKLCLSECEIFEPHLYFMGDSELANRFIDCIESWFQHDSPLKISTLPNVSEMQATSNIKKQTSPSPLSFPSIQQQSSNSQARLSRSSSSSKILGFRSDNYSELNSLIEL